MRIELVQSLELRKDKRAKWRNSLNHWLKTYASNYAEFQSAPGIEVKGITAHQLELIAVEIAVAAINSDRKSMVHEMQRTLDRFNRAEIT